MRKTIIGLCLLAVAAVPASASAGSTTDPQHFEIYDETQDGLQAADADIGNVNAVANPGGQDRLILQAHLQDAAPNCTLSVELVRDDFANNGGLDAFGHTGFIQVLGTVKTNKQGNGNFHYDGDPSPDSPGTAESFAHLDFEDRTGTCVENDGTGVSPDEYGAAPLPELLSPLRFFT